MEFREFYSVVLQTLLHPLGKVDSMKFNPLELVGHLQRIFKVPNALHSTLVKEEINRRPESFVLRVTVVEAKDIKGMDPNGKSDPYCLLTLCNKRVGSPSQGQHHLQVQPQHSRSSSYEPLIRDPAQPLQHANTLPAMTTTSPQGADKGNNNKHLSPQTSLPEASHVHSLQRNITRNRSFNRKDRRRKSLEHLGLGYKNQVLQQDLHLAVPTDSSLKTRKVSESGFSPSLPHNNALEEGALYRTSCQKETLHPVWSETFDIELNRLDGELRITMWDLDEETTLWDACKSLDSDHKIAGIKNIFRHMRHGISKCTDDFLGQVIIPLEKIEAATITEDWFRLQRGHARVISSQVTGKLHLKLQFIRKELEAREERHQKALSFYHQLVAAAQKHEAAKHIRAKDSGWDGKLSALTQHVLNQFAVQSGIPRVSQNIIYLSALLDFQIEFDKKNKEAEVTAKNRAKKPLPLSTSHSSSPSLSSSPTEKKDRQKGEGTPELVRRAAIRRGKTPPGSPSRLSRGEEFDFGLSFDQPLTTSTGKPLVVVNDRMVREALYKIHAEMMAESALTIFGSNPEGVATLFESKPDWLRYETAIVENSISTYIYEILALLPDCAEFYPPTNVPGLESANVKCKLQLLQSLLSMRIWRDHNTPVHRLVSNLMESVVRNDTRRAISNDLDSIPIQDTSLKPVELVDLLDRTTAVINRLTADCKPHKDYKNFFSRFQVDYFATVSLEMDRQVSKFLLNEVLKRLNQYQARYRRFPQNIAESSKASLLLYMAVKQLVAVLKKNLNGHDDLTLWNHNLWFQDPLGYWLMTFQHETFDRVHKALEMDKEVRLVHEVVKYSNSAVDVQACFAKVIQEWQSIGYNCPNSRCMAITKLTDMICEGAKLYACKIHWILEANGFYKTNKAQQFDIKDKLCITLNNIEHVRVYLDNLPALLEWKANCAGLALYHDNKGAGELTLKTLYRLTAAASQDIRVMSAHLERRIAFKMSQEVHRLMDKVVNPDKKVLCEECMEDLLDYIDDNLGTLYKQLMPQIFPQLVQELWQALLQSIKSRVQEGRPPGYYKRLQHSLDSLEAYFQRPGIELTTAQTQTETYHAIMAGLAPNMRSTHDLMADYYRRLATDMATPVAYLGHVSIKIAYHEVAEGLRSLSIKVCNAVDLPGMDRNGLSDPQVTVEICPETSFNKVLSFKTKIVLRQLNPVFNEVFQFGALPAEAFASDSVIIAVTVVDHNKLLPNSFIGEAFIPLLQARPITERQTVDHCPAIMLALKRPRRLRGYCQILQNRSRWDKNARQFIAKRTWAIQQQRQRTDKRIESRFSHNAFFPE
ncbi:protein unc-13 homolog D-like [Diadema setosum]|uniref:protein unc-13 homolog D-like n=1 Tax=Diadema setosum TaxID=31175 RepID=UPI003B3BDBC9